ncbi:MAG: DUF427 domain-containing protein [Candidatus Saccharibacteria bacterium]|nr:DUF427 domain-containing protein [Candidatus Saccharibacteria bacterium]
MRAIFNGKTIAEAPKEDLIYIEGNWYFPLSSVDESVYEKTDTPYTCPWKGEAQYYNVTVDGETAEDGMFQYPDAKEMAVQRVKKDFRDHVAFWHGVEVTE